MDNTNQTNQESTITYEDFHALVYNKWKDEQYMYGAVSAPAAAVLQELKDIGIDATEHYNTMSKRKTFNYTGD